MLPFQNLMLSRNGLWLVSFIHYGIMTVLNAQECHVCQFGFWITLEMYRTTTLTWNNDADSCHELFQ